MDEANFQPVPKSGTSLHSQIYLVLRDSIISGRYGSGDMLPSEETLAKSFRVSRPTLRRALADLEAAGFVDRQQGRGTFVRRDRALRSVTLPMRMAADEIDRSGKTEVRVVEFDYVLPPVDIARSLGLDERQPAQRAVRVRFRDGVPVLHLTTYVPEVIGRTYDSEEMGRMPLRHLLERAGRGYRKGVQAVGAVLADPSVASLLRIKIGAPLVYIRRLLTDAQDRPVEYLELRAQPSDYELQMTFEADDGQPGRIKLLDYRSRLRTQDR